METLLKVLQFLGMIGGIIAMVIAAKIWLREQNHYGVSKAKDEVIALLNTELVAQKAHSDRCDKEVLHYREEVHAIRNSAQENVLQANKETENAKEIARALQIQNAELKVKTDLSPVMETVQRFSLEQTKINQEILSAMEKISRYFEKINGLLTPALAIAAQNKHA